MRYSVFLHIYLVSLQFSLKKKYMPVYLACNLTFTTKSSHKRHSKTCKEKFLNKVASRTCHFCGGPGKGELFEDVHEHADHVLTSHCWKRINMLRTTNPELLGRLFAPTRANYELIRDTIAGVNKAFKKDRAHTRRTYELDEGTHQEFLMRAGSSIADQPDQNDQELESPTGLSLPMSSLMSDDSPSNAGNYVQLSMHFSRKQQNS